MGRTRVMVIIPAQPGHRAVPDSNPRQQPRGCRHGLSTRGSSTSVAQTVWHIPPPVGSPSIRPSGRLWSPRRRRVGPPTLERNWVGGTARSSGFGAHTPPEPPVESPYASPRTPVAVHRQARGTERRIVAARGKRTQPGIRINCWRSCSWNGQRRRWIAVGLLGDIVYANPEGARMLHYFDPGTLVQQLLLSW